MEKAALNFLSPYKDSTIFLSTKHAKSMAIAPVFFDRLGAKVIEHMIDTDQLGTFSGEIERKHRPLDCARLKCEGTLALLGEKASFVIASEGSFGPHPFLPFMPCDHEILYFIDTQRKFHLHVSLLSEKTNYAMKVIRSMDELDVFAQSAQFPSHALILRSDLHADHSLIFKGLNSIESLENAFKEIKRKSSTGLLRVETDMRAHLNPSRMAVIKELAFDLAARLSSFCPLCKTPGWGKVGEEKGLLCESCFEPSKMVFKEIFACSLCQHKEFYLRKDGLTYAPSMYCNYCNP